MTIDITLARQGNKGTNFNAYVDSFVDSFTSSGFPFFEEDAQMVIVGQNQQANTKIFVLDGSDYEYDFPTHTVSGRMDAIALGTLGGSYNSDGSFDLDGQNHITGHIPVVTFSGLGLVNPRGERGDVHEIVAELMYLGGPDARGTPTFDRVVFGQAHDVTGSAGGDAYAGTRWGDRALGLGGNDTLAGGAGNDTVDGGVGNDSLRGGGNNDVMKGGDGNDRMGGDSGADAIAGGAGDDFVDGSTDNDRVFGEAGNDRVLGGAGVDTLTGGAGKDILTGGTEKDTFVFASVAESTAALRDTVSDFTAIDVVSLTAIDADTTRAGNQAFVLSADFTGRAGELVAVVNATGTVVVGDTNGNGTADFTLFLSGYATPAANDFLL